MIFETKTSGGAEVTCRFSVSDEGDVENFVVTHKGVIVNEFGSSLINEDTCDELADACYTHYMAVAADCKYDHRISSRIECMEAA